MYLEPRMGGECKEGLMGVWKGRGEVGRRRLIRGKVCGIRTGDEAGCEDDLGLVSNSAFSEMVSEMLRAPMRSL